MSLAEIRLECLKIAKMADPHAHADRLIEVASKLAAFIQGGKPGK